MSAKSIAFSGRVLTAEASAAKYLNSPETPLFRKGQVLFGLHKTKRALIEADCAIVCEGQLDLITLFEAGIRNVVAPQGTAFTERQAHVLKRFVREVVLCFDADAAGMKAAERSLEALLQNDLLVRVAEMPAGEDPDSLVRKSGRETFEKLVAQAPDFFDYWIEKKASATNLHSLGAKMQVARELAETVSHVRDPMMRREMINKIAARLAIRAADFEKLIAQPRSAIAATSDGTGSAYGKERTRGRLTHRHRTMWPCFACLPCAIMMRGIFCSSRIGAMFWRSSRARTCLTKFLMPICDRTILLR